MSEIDVIWIEAAEDALHDSGQTHILASEKHVDWLASHLEKMSRLDPIERASYHTQFVGIGLYGSDMASAMRTWANRHSEK